MKKKNSKCRKDRYNFNRLLLVLILCWVGFLLIACSATNQTSAVEDKPESATESATESTTESNAQVEEKTFELAALQKDFETFKSCVDYFHPMLYADRPAVTALMTEKYAAIEDGMTALEFYRLVAPIVSQLRCGHTYLGLSESDYAAFIETEKFLPFNVYWQSGKALVRENALAPELPIGAEILSINNVPIADVVTGIFENFGADGTNETLKIRNLNAAFRYHYAIDNPSLQQTQITYMDVNDQKQKEMTVMTVSKSEVDAAGDAFWEQPWDSARANNSRFEKDYAVLQMVSFYPEGGDTVASYNAFIDTFFAQVKEKNIENIILDVRNNFGGDPNVAAHLLSYLEKEPVPYFLAEKSFSYPSLCNPIPVAAQPYTGKLYVLINGNCFSTTGHLLALLKYHKIGTMIGEESGGSFACSDSSKSIELKNTGLQFRYSTKVYQVDVTGLTPGRGIMPDYPVVATLESFMAKTDLEMAKAIELIQGK